jgi:aldehyde:ferredoxin oxidoreductase
VYLKGKVDKERLRVDMNMYNKGGNVMANGYNGKILMIDLNNLDYNVIYKDDYFYRTFMGGSAMASYFLLTEMEKGVDPLGPDNVLVFSTSIITGTAVPGANRYTVAAKSPLTHAFGEAEAGGYWAVELKKAGFDAIVIKGKAPRPVYIWIENGSVDFKDAAHLWGNDTGFTEETIRKELGDEKIKIAAIGQGGENLVLYAAIIHNLRHTNGRTGMGAVMGSKNLKAVAVRGTEELSFYDQDKNREIAKYFAKTFKTHPIQSILAEGGTVGWDVESLNAAGVLPTRNFHGGAFDDFEGMTWNQMKKTVYKGRDSCFACPIRCKQICEGGKYDIDARYGGPEYETAGAFGSNLEIGDIELISKAHELCNKYSIDTISTGMTIGFAMECYENGILSIEDTDGIDLRFGNADAVLKLIEKIAFKDGFGALLAEGSYRAAQQIGKGAEKFAMTVKKQEFAMHEPRGKNGLSLAYATSPTGADHVEAAHDLPFEEGKFGVPDLYPLGILKGVPGRDLGPYKVRQFVYNQHIWSLFNTISLCIFVAGPGKLYKMNHVVDMVANATGWDTSLFELMAVGERTTTLAKLYNVREGLDRRDDVLPDRLFEELESGILTGKKLDREQFEFALDMYYEMMGWDIVTGEPRQARLYQLNIADLDPVLNQKEGNTVEIRLKIPVLYQVTGTDHFVSHGRTLKELIDNIDAMYPGFKDIALKDDKIAGFIQVYFKKVKTRQLTPANSLDVVLNDVKETIFLPVVCGG